MSWRQARQGVEAMVGRYVPFNVERDDELVACFDVLDRVRRAELHRPVHLSAGAAGRGALEGGGSRLVGIRDRLTGAVVGTARATPADRVAESPDAVRTYRLDRVPPALRDRVWVSTRLAVLPEHRGGPAALLMLRHMYAEGLRCGGLATILTCEPGLLAMYRRMGFEPLGPVAGSAQGGFRIPLVVVFHDAERFAATRSPLAGVLRTHPGPHPQAGIAWRAGLSPLSPAEVGVQAYDPELGLHADLCAGLSPAGCSQVLRGALRVRCAAGQVVVAAGDGGRSWGLVARGHVEVDRPGSGGARRLGPGAVFGPRVALLGVRHPADVTAGPDTEVVLLSRSARRRLGDGADGRTLDRTLARLARAQGASARAATVRTAWGEPVSVWERWLGGARRRVGPAPLAARAA